MDSFTNEPYASRRKHYFVDEAGDAVLFGSRGKVLIESIGCSRFFMLGLLDVPEPETLSRDLSTLHGHLLADPYFAKVPSMQPSQRKTYFGFHAKDDVPEVRREVFSILRKHDLKFFAVIRDKNSILSYVREQNIRSSSYKYNANELYDSMVSRLFKERLHKEDIFNVCFAKRGQSDRTDALKAALAKARNRFSVKWGIQIAASIVVTPASPPESRCLQATDYLLWCLQRLYERQEDRYIDLMWPLFSLVHDVDDVRLKPYGTYYTQKHPLTASNVQKRVPRI